MIPRDIEVIKSRISEIFVDEFTDVLTNGNYDVITDPDHDVLIVKPAIIDVDIKSPIDSHNIPTVTYTTEVATATLVLELFDSIINEILASVVESVGVIPDTLQNTLHFNCFL